jgi:hypothetical protein
MRSSESCGGPTVKPLTADFILSVGITSTHTGLHSLKLTNNPLTHVTINAKVAGKVHILLWCAQRAVTTTITPTEHSGVAATL